MYIEKKFKSMHQNLSYQVFKIYLPSSGFLSSWDDINFVDIHTCTVELTTDNIAILGLLITKVI